MSNLKLDSQSPPATPFDIQRLLGNLEATTVSAILALTPTIAEVEKAALWAEGEGETLTVRHQPRGTVDAILNLITVDEDDERRKQ